MASVTLAGCAGARAPAAVTATAPLTLTLLDTVVLPSVTQPPAGRREAWFGSLSGLAQDVRSGRYLAVIDDRRPARVTWIDITATDGKLKVEPGGVQPLTWSAPDQQRSVAAADLEAIVALPDGSWVASEEGHVLAADRGRPDAEQWTPALLTFNSDLRVTRVEPWPARFHIGPDSGGVRDNQGFESLARTPDGRLIAGLEQPRYADLPATLRNGRPYGGGRGGPSRLIELVDRDGRWTPGREWVYPLDATGRRPAFDTICDDGENGLSDLLAIDDSRLIAIERACLIDRAAERVRNIVRLYLVDVSGADDVSPPSGVAVASARPVHKALLVDFDTLIPRWPPELQRLDNFEALAFGPVLADGSRTLLVVSDDNFRPTQNTVFLWFRIGERR